METAYQNEKIPNRWLVVAGSLLMQLSLGAIYTWSLFNRPLVEAHGWTPGDTVFTFSITLAFFSVAVIFAGRIQDKIGPKKVAIVGGLLTGLGVALASFATNVYFLYLTYGVIAGIGIGAAYVTPLATCVKWFPEKRGLITGLILAALGVGGMVFKPIILIFITKFGVSQSFLYLGCIYGVLIVAGAMLLAVPPKGYRPPGWTPPVSQAGAAPAGSRRFSTGQAMRTPQFYMLVAWMFFGSAAALMIISVAANIGMTMIGLSLAAAGNAVVTIALFNACGRLGWGWISDRFGRKPSILANFIMLSLAMFYMALIPMTYAGFLVATCVVGFCFGGLAAMLPTLTAEWFGLANVGNNYGAVFIFYGIAALTAPRLSIAIGFESAFLVAGIACVIGAVIAIFARAPGVVKQPDTLGSEGLKPKVTGAS
ncbi:OFA family oxalate/formate antiporter-like MFS transporter [Desulfobotulus alkaliphilus]|uniref:OFA family oxalate/formate antiporter-like MFS transporter n=1 Tax=Desulfobotulus alkaliphilus TaxID=622671 RepID=A0A562RPX6_9BACT|nr:OFA family MFS transporter [Desulfobotulus alkaliphilus]TWI71115.1 OFA family oxalate/formate antiporter-like MFS transporter [Desulfobotulus alkaliphilus]